jgi:hypothetical protein
MAARRGIGKLRQFIIGPGVRRGGRRGRRRLPFLIMRRNLLAPLTACVLLLSVAAAVDACPGCKDSVSDTAASADGGPGGPVPGLPSGFNYSIYVMLAGLFSVMGLVAGIVVRGIRGSTPAAPRPGFPVSTAAPR